MADGSINLPAGQTIIATYLCPSDPGGVINSSGLAPTNYLINVGSGLVNQGCIYATTSGMPDGISYQASSVCIAGVTDGTSNTLAFGESIVGLGGANDQAAAVLSNLSRQQIRNGFNAPSCNVAPSSDSFWGDRCDKWISGSFPYAAMTFYYPPNSPTPDCLDLTYQFAYMGPRSYHPGGVNSLFCDGHASFLSNTIAQATIQALATRAGGEVIPPF